MKLLIIIDMQNDFLVGKLGNDMCKNAIKPVCELIASTKWDGIFATRDTHFDNYQNTLEGENLPVEHCIKDTWGWQLNGDVESYLRGRDPKYVNKPTFGSFCLIDKIEALRLEECDNNLYLSVRNGECGENLELHVCGVCTSICVLANVVLLRARYPDAKIFVHADACGDVTPKMHESAIVCFKSQQCEVVGE